MQGMAPFGEPYLVRQQTPSTIDVELKGFFI